MKSPGPFFPRLFAISAREPLEDGGDLFPCQTALFRDGPKISVFVIAFLALATFAMRSPSETSEMIRPPTGNAKRTGRILTDHCLAVKRFALKIGENRRPQPSGAGIEALLQRRGTRRPGIGALEPEPAHEEARGPNWRIENEELGTGNGQGAWLRFSVTVTVAGTVTVRGSGDGSGSGRRWQGQDMVTVTRHRHGHGHDRPSSVTVIRHRIRHRHPSPSPSAVTVTVTVTVTVRWRTLETSPWR